eukprot:Gb_09921 [translate_table: standard]
MALLSFDAIGCARSSRCGAYAVVIVHLVGRGLSSASFWPSSPMFTTEPNEDSILNYHSSAAACHVFQYPVNNIHNEYSAGALSCSKESIQGQLCQDNSETNSNLKGVGQFLSC